MRVRRELCVRQLMSLCDILEQTDILTLARHSGNVTGSEPANCICNLHTGCRMSFGLRTGSRPRPLCLFVLSGNNVL